MEILRLTEAGSIESSALARKLRVKIMQWIGLIEVQRTKVKVRDISEQLEEVIDSLLSALSDKVID